MDGDTSQKGKEIKKPEVSRSAAPPLDLVKLRVQQKDLIDELNYQCGLALKEHREHRIKLEQEQARKAGITDMDAEISKQVSYYPIGRVISSSDPLAQGGRVTTQALLNNGDGTWSPLPREGNK